MEHLQCICFFKNIWQGISLPSWQDRLFKGKVFVCLFAFSFFQLENVQMGWNLCVFFSVFYAPFLSLDLPKCGPQKFM